MTRLQLIRLIHVARREAGIDDDTYRAKLATTIPGKNSCQDMTLAELEKVYQAFRDQGFKRCLTVVKTARKPRATESQKILTIWQTMHQDGFVQDGSPAALDAYVRRMTSRVNGEGVARLSWLTPALASRVLESLKKWHSRLMAEALKSKGLPVPRNYAALSDAYKCLPKG